MDIAKNLLSKGRDIIDNTDLFEVSREIDEINKKLENDIEAVKPEILKLHNYAFEVALKALESGSADKEVFNLAEKLYNEDKKSIQAEVFPELPNVKLEEFAEIFENYKVYSKSRNHKNQFFLSVYFYLPALPEIWQKCDIGFYNR